MLLFPSLIFLTVSCQEEAPYNLSQIPIPEDAIPTDDPLAKPPPLGSIQQCLPEKETEKEITLDDKIILNLTLPPEAKAQQIILDFINPSFGNVLYGIVCEGHQLKVPVLKNLGVVKLAVFIDKNKNGPSADDIQGLSEELKIEVENIALDNLTLGKTPLTFYNFGIQEPENPPKEPPPEFK